MLAPDKNQGFELLLCISNIIVYSENFTKLFLLDNSNPGVLYKFMHRNNPFSCKMYTYIYTNINNVSCDKPSS